MRWQEKRSSVRYTIELPIRYRLLNESKQTPKTQRYLPYPKTKNISDAGLLFLSSQYFKIGSLLELTFPVKDRVFTMEGCVVHASRDAESGLYRTGIYFPNPDHVFKVKLADQFRQIEQYRKTLTEEKGRIVSEEEAAQEWIEKHSSEFAEFYK